MGNRAVLDRLVDAYYRDDVEGVVSDGTDDVEYVIRDLGVHLVGREQWLGLVRMIATGVPGRRMTVLRRGRRGRGRARVDPRGDPRRARFPASRPPESSSAGRAARSSSSGTPVSRGGATTWTLCRRRRPCGRYRRRWSGRPWASARCRGSPARRADVGKEAVQPRSRAPQAPPHARHP